MQMNPEQFLLTEVGRRDETDYRFSWITYFGWTLLTAGFYSIYGTLKLVERRVNHVRRRLAVSTSLWHALAARADRTHSRPDVQEGLDNLSRIHAQIESYERKNRRNPQAAAAIRGALIVGVITGASMFAARYDIDLPVEEQDPLAGIGSLIFDLSLIGLLISGAITNAMLARDFKFLDVWETSWTENVEWVMRRLNMTPVVAPRRPAPKRPTGLYVVVTLLTMGVFSIGWRHAMIVDGNRHFDDDAAAEDAILRALGTRSEPAASGNAPAPPASEG